jgi:hypothetical protein
MLKRRPQRTEDRPMHLPRSRRVAAIISITVLGAGAAFGASPAQAGLLDGLLGGNQQTQTTTSKNGSLLGLLPNLGTIITSTGQTLGSLIPGLGGVVTGVTGVVGGLVGGVQDTVTSLVDQTLGGVLGGVTSGSSSLLPTTVLNPLLGTLLNSSLPKPGATTSTAPIVLSGGKIGANGAIVDASAPRPDVKVLSHLKGIGRDGRLRLEVRTDEPGIVAVAGSVRPGDAVKRTARHSRRLIKVPNVVLAYRKAGRLVMTVKLSRAAQRALGTSKNARMSIGTVASDLFRNQDSETVNLNIGR